MHFENKGILINDRPSGFHQKIKKLYKLYIYNCIHCIIDYILFFFFDYILENNELLFWLIVDDNLISYCQIYTCGDWKNSLQASLYLGILLTLSSSTTHRLLVRAASGHTHFAIWPLVLNLWVEGMLRSWAEVFQEVMPTQDG